MSNDSTLALDGLFTRFGSKVENFQGFGHEQDEDGRWYWFFTADLSGENQDGTSYRLENRKVFLDQVVHDVDDKTGHQNMCELSDACMHYLNENGEWHEDGCVWRAAA